MDAYPTLPYPGQIADRAGRRKAVPKGESTLRHRERPRLGELLITQGAIDAQALDRGLRLQRRTGAPLGRALLETALVPPSAVWNALSRQDGVPFVSLEALRLDTVPTELLPSTFVRTESVLPLWLEDSEDEETRPTLVVGMVAPIRAPVLEEAARLAKRRISVRLVSDDAFEWAVSRLYAVQTPIPATLPSVGAYGSELSFDDGRLWTKSEPAAERVKAASRKGELLLFGWARASEAGLALLAASEGHPARAASSASLAASRPEDVAVLPLAEAERLAAFGIFPAAKLVLTSEDPERDRARARRAGARLVLAEPLNPEEVLAVLRAELAGPNSGCC